MLVTKWSINEWLELVFSKWLAQGHIGLTDHRCSFCLALLRGKSLLFVPDHTTQIGMKDLL